MHAVNGLHHITAIAGPAQENLDFYAGVLGMRLVKKSVNQDDPGTYHLFYADAEGHPGTDLTFFPWAADGAAADRPRARGRSRASKCRQAASTSGASGSSTYGTTASAIETRFGDRALPLVDPHGLQARAGRKPRALRADSSRRGTTVPFRPSIRFAVCTAPSSGSATRGDDEHF